MKELSMGQISSLFKVPKSTVRHYIDKRVLNPQRQEENGYYSFSERDIYRLYQIITLRNIGYTVSEISSLLSKDSILPELIKTEEKIKDKIRKLENVLESVKEIIHSQEVYKIDEVIFMDREERHFRVLEESAEATQLYESEQVFYIYSVGKESYRSVLKASIEDKNFSFPAGNYACKSFVVENEEQIIEAVQSFLSDPLFEMLNINEPEILIYENIYSSLVYSNTLIYTIEVKL